MTHDELVAAFSAHLGPSYRLSPDLPEGRVTVRLDPGVLTAPLIAIPDCHLSDASGGDEFLDGDVRNVARLEAVLVAIKLFQGEHPDARAVQLGDWFDLWRATSSRVQSTADYQRVLELDAEIGLAHIIGNHDAAFLNSVPCLRAQQRSSFRLGASLMPLVYAMHGHQTDVTPPAPDELDMFVVAAATSVARFVPDMRTFEAYVDADLGLEDALAAAIKHAFGQTRPDPAPAARVPDRRPGSPDANAPFVVREKADVLAAIACKVADLSGQPHPKLVVVGHSHNPAVAWSSAGGSPLVIADAGACVFGRFNLLLAAGDRLTVFDVL